MEIKTSITNFLRYHTMLVTSGVNDRNRALDYAKAVAIILIVVGHTIQNQQANFTENMAWRFIYSFHMPLFAFLSGASAVYYSGKIFNAKDIRSTAKASFDRISISALSLIAPFFCWGLLAYWINYRSSDFYDYFINLIKHTDSGLWFLPCIFWCIFYLSTYLLLLKLIVNILELTPFYGFSKYFSTPLVQVILLYFIWSNFKSKAPFELGLDFANNFHGGLFLFFILGFLLFKPFISVQLRQLRIIPYAIFLLLVPYWYWTFPTHLGTDPPDFLKTQWAAENFAFIVAITGTYVFIDISKILHQPEFVTVNKFMYFLGSASLAVYAMHFYFLQYRPYVLTPILISLLLYVLIGYLPFIRRFFLGK